MAGIHKPVGKNKPNLNQDVKTIQALLNRQSHLLKHFKQIADTGHYGPETEAAIERFQKEILKIDKPDLVIDPHGRTMRYLIGHKSPLKHHHKENSHAAIYMMKQALFVDAAAKINPMRNGQHIEPATIMAVVLNETEARGPFDEKGQPTILFEPHVFQKLTKNKYDRSNSDVSNGSMGSGKFSAQRKKFDEAVKLNEDAAICAASWGAFQIMGGSWEALGYKSPRAFMDSMSTLDGQVDAFVKFMNSDQSLIETLGNHEWTKFARKYNGKAQSKNHYDTKLREHYGQLTREVTKPPVTASLPLRPPL